MSFYFFTIISVLISRIIYLLYNFERGFEIFLWKSLHCQEKKKGLRFTLVKFLQINDY